MVRRIKVWGACLLLIVGVGFVSIGDAEPAVPALGTGVEELIRYPQQVAPSESAGLYVVVLPGTVRAVLLRPVGEEEFGSYQVQAIAPETIAHQLLAVAFVFPVVQPQNVAAFPRDLTRFPRETVNRISRLTVFDDDGPPTS